MVSKVVVVPAIYEGDALTQYGNWPAPDLIISDGAYGVGGFPGDPHRAKLLPQWYAQHIRHWSQVAKPNTTLWFWNTEQGWAAVHPLLLEQGWRYVQTITWNKGVGHIAGRVNGNTMRQFPIVTEICVFYARQERWTAGGTEISMQKWLRSEWLRTGLPLREANIACGVKNAATRKYLTADWLWYLPPPEVMHKLIAYANQHGNPEGRPYFSANHTTPITDSDWERLRYTWHHQHGLTNVWEHPPLRNTERVRGTGTAMAHLNQKPLVFMERIVQAATNPLDVVWEPFGGLCSGAIAAGKLGRIAFGAEINANFYQLARKRIRETLVVS